MFRRYAPIVLLAAAVAGCGSVSGGTDATPSDSALASAAQQVAQPAASPTPTGPCLTRKCITEDIEQDAVGMVAADSSVVTAAKCRPARRNPGDTWTAHCTVTYTDGSKVPGNITLIPATNRLAFQPDGA
jgi:hypothetical protein